MSIALSITIIACSLIVCSFAFFTLVYLSELKRERRIQEMVNDPLSLQELLNTALPLVLVDPKEIQNEQEPEPLTSKDKKSVN